MFNGNFYGLIITILTMVIAVVLTMRQVQETGIRFELTVQRVKAIIPAQKARQGGIAKGP